MSKTSCDLRVIVRFNDGTMGAYAVDDIPSASRLRDELQCAGQVFSDQEVGEDLQPEAECVASMRSIFDDVQSGLARIAPDCGRVG